MPDSLDEDWIKRGSWDLPTETDAFIGAVWRPGLTERQSIALFMELPAATRMPARLRHDLRMRGLLQEPRERARKTRRRR